MTCPFCGAENIDGVDACDACGQSLNEESASNPSQVEQRLLADGIYVLNPKPAVTVTADTPVRAVLRLMVDRGVGGVVVVEGRRPVGFFSERDALVRLGAEVRTRGDQPVGEFMTPNPEAVEADAKVVFAVKRMDVGGYRHLPIVDEAGELTGMISVRDILQYLAQTLARATDSV